MELIVKMEQEVYRVFTLYYSCDLDVMDHRLDLICQLLGGCRNVREIDSKVLS